MILNRSKQLKLKNVLILYSNLLQKCCKEIQDEDEKDRSKDALPKVIKTPAIRLGYPYFKDNKGYRAPKHPEIIKKKTNGEISPHYLQAHCRWTLDDQSILTSEVKFQYKKIQTECLISAIEDLNEILKTVDNKDECHIVINSLQAKQSELDELKQNVSGTIPPLDFLNIDWEKISEEVGGEYEILSTY